MSKRRKKWFKVRCHECGGTGYASLMSYAPDDCRLCQGNGVLWKSPKGAIAQYPGGPFCGRLTDKEMQAR